MMSNAIENLFFIRWSRASKSKGAKCVFVHMTYFAIKVIEKNYFRNECVD